MGSTNILNRIYNVQMHFKPNKVIFNERINRIFLTKRMFNSFEIVDHLKEEKKISLLATQNRLTLTNRIFKRIVAQPNPPQIPLDILKLYNNSRVIDTFRSLSTKFYPDYVPHYLSP